jgi:hypothetical protein
LDEMAAIMCKQKKARDEERADNDYGAVATVYLDL